MVEQIGKVRIGLALSLVVIVMLVPSGAGATGLQAFGGDQPTAATAEIELTFSNLIDQERSAAGLSPLSTFDDLADGARLHAAAMAESGDLYHNPDLTQITENWFQLGENVGYASSVEILHQGFMNSPPHMANVLNETYNYVGVGAAVDGNGTIWISIAFMYGPEDLLEAEPPAQEEPVLPFFDVDGSVHAAAIAAITEAGITFGCDTDGVLYCPTALVTRAQMAAFLARALDLPETARDNFSDDNGSRHEDSINRLAEAGVTVGCTESSFCPGALITRAQMAALLTRALDLPQVSFDFFNDDQLSPHQASINALAAAGITSGCTAKGYCPLDHVTRGQMATFLARALNLI